MANADMKTTTIDTVVLPVKVNKELQKNLQEQGNEMGERGYLLCSSFVLADDVVCIYQRSK